MKIKQILRIINRYTIRETFFESQLSVGHQLRLPQKGDFLVNDKFVFEVGGKNKSAKQIKDLENAYLVLDDIPEPVFIVTLGSFL